MNANQNYSEMPGFEEAVTIRPSFDLKATFRRYVYHWPLFLIFILLSLTSAFVYLLNTKPVYIINAKLMIKDNTEKTNEEIALKQLNETEQPKGIDGEMEVLRSKTLMAQIVDDLQLWVTYEQKGKYKSTNLYGVSPVKLQLTDADKYNAGTFDIFIDDTSHYHIVDEEKTPVLLAFDDTMKNLIGNWKLEKTATTKNFTGKTITITVADTNAVVNGYLNKLKLVNLDKNVPIVNLTIEDEIPARGMKILDELIEDYHKESAAAKKRATKNTLDFIDARLASLTGELNGVEKNVEEFKSSRGLTDLPSDSKVSVDNFQSNDNHINDINLQLEVVRNIERYVNTGNDTEPPPATIGITDQGLNNLVTQLTNLQLERNKLLANTPARNPIFAPIDKQINATKDALKHSISGIKASLMAMKGELLNNNSKFQSTIKSIPGQEMQLVGIKRQQGSKENLYDYLLQKREEVALDYAATIPAATTIEDANFGGLKSSKNNLILALAFVFGFAAPVALILGRDALSGLILDQNTIVTHTGAPVVCEIMQNDNCSPEMILNKSRYIIGEQFRELRTKLHFLHNKKERGRVTLFTSSIAGEGKSFVATNLGVTLAAARRKTIILELDMRIPKIHEILKLGADHIGLSSYLNGEAEIYDIIRTTPLHPDLFIISTGKIPENPSELLENSKMTALIAFLRLEFDDILVDSPPLHLVTDALILANLCDVTLYIVKQAFTPISELAFIKRTYREKKLPKMNIVFNGVENAGRYSYGYKLDNNYYRNERATKPHSAWVNFLSRF